jgi:hypothetical protein
MAPRIVIGKKVRITLTILLFFPGIMSFAQEFGCFSEPDAWGLDAVYHKQHVNYSNYDSIFWLSYPAPLAQDGYYKSWWNKYQIKTEGNIVDGKREGIWLVYSQFENSFTKVNFVHGIKEGEWEQYKVVKGDTLCTTKGHYSNDRGEGLQISYKSDTVIEEIRNLHEGKLDGVVISYAFTEDQQKFIQSISHYDQDTLDALLLENDLDENGHPFLRYSREYNDPGHAGNSYTF